MLHVTVVAPEADGVLDAAFQSRGHRRETSGPAAASTAAPAAVCSIWRRVWDGATRPDGGDMT